MLALETDKHLLSGVRSKDGIEFQTANTMEGITNSDKSMP